MSGHWRHRPVVDDHPHAAREALSQTSLRRSGGYAAFTESGLPAPRGAQPDFNAAWKDYSWGLYEAQLKQLLAMVQGKAKLVIMMVPYEPQLLARADANQAFVRKPQRMLAALCKKYGVPCLDLFEAFSAEHERKEKLYIDGIHLNYAGHQLVFSQLMRFLPRTEPR